MELFYDSGVPLSVKCDAVIVPVAKGSEGVQFDAVLTQINESLGGSLPALLSSAQFEGTPGSTMVVPSLGLLPATRVVLAGIGSLSDLTADTLRNTYGAAAAAARQVGAQQVIAALPDAGKKMNGAAVLESAVAGVLLGTYRFGRYYGTVKNAKPQNEIDALTFVDAAKGANATAAIARGTALANGVNLARDLHNEPAGTLNPAKFAEIAAQVAKDNDLEIRIFGPEELEALGAQAILTVGRGSTSTPRMIHMTYRPSGTPAETVGIAGKCITFDTGGYSIKPGDGMLDMKGDMDGGGAVLGAMSALRGLGCERTVHCVICAAENMISGDAFRPGDVIQGMNGVTMEIVSTDAEGRLVLADGLVYMSRQGVSEMIDLATLTGAKVIALGDKTSALFANNDDLARNLLTAAEDAGESLWRMPLSPHLEDQIKADIADIKNTGGRSGGAITAALFIQHFSENLPWAHLDIAGGNRTAKGDGQTPKGATGVGVRTLLSYLLR